jgi:hypothetical protein
MQLDCPATVSTDSASGSVLCQDGTGASVAWVVTPDFDVSQIDPATMTAFVAWGFFVICLGMLPILGVKWFLKFLRSA